MKSSSKTFEIVRFGAAPEVVSDEVAIEEPLQIRIGRHELTVTMRTPGRDVDLALGLLFAEGLLNLGADAGAMVTANNVVTAKLPNGTNAIIPQPKRFSPVTSSCGVCGKRTLAEVEASIPHAELPRRWVVSSDLLLSLPDKLRQRQQTFDTTGGLHAAGLFDLSGYCVDVAEDIGRHNAVDKLIGLAYSCDFLPLDEHVLVLSGRAGFELVQKAAMAGIGLVLSVGAPSSLAVELAREVGLTLCGFARGEGFNCYARAERISTK